MVAGGVVPASEIDSDLLQRLRTPSFNADASEEYDDIKNCIDALIRGFWELGRAKFSNPMSRRTHLPNKSGV